MLKNVYAIIFCALSFLNYQQGENKGEISMPSKVILKGRQIICSQIVTKDIQLATYPYFFVKGIVYSPKGEPLADAAVEIVLVNNAIVPTQEKSLGVTFTMADGTYGVSIPYVENREYKLIAYASLEEW